MSLDDVVNVTVNINQSTVAQQGFGTRFLDAAGFGAFLGEQDTKYRAYFGS